MENQDKKRVSIIEAALKRFAHFGLAKTTMTEIAADLAFSKALLYYYFPDKISLYAAVLEFIVEQVEEDIKAGMNVIEDCEDAICFYLDKRNSYIKKYFNIFELIRTSGPELSPDLLPVLEKAKQAELGQITVAIEKGVEQGELKAEDPSEVASLLMDAFIGMRILTFQHKRQFVLDDAQFESTLSRQKQLARIFLNGLRTLPGKTKTSV